MPINRDDSHPLALIAVIAVLLTVAGCAHGPQPVQQTQAIPAASKSDNSLPASPSEEVVDANGTAYELVKTPFGVVKRKKQWPQPSTPDASSTDIIVEHSVREKSSSSDTTTMAFNPEKKQPQKIVYPPVDRLTSAPTDPADGGVTLNFDDADLYEVIRTMAEILQINYIVDPGVRGKVTIHTAGHIDRKDLFPIFFQILEANGLTAVKEGPVYKIASLKDTARLPILYRQGLNQQALPPGERVVMQIVPLENIEVGRNDQAADPIHIGRRNHHFLMTRPIPCCWWTRASTS